MLELSCAILLIVLVFASWALNLVTLPGNWLIVVLVALYAWLLPGDSRLAIGWSVVVLLVLLATLGEVIEAVAGAVSSARAGGSRRGMVLAVVGSIIGGILGVGMGVPVPIVGPVIGAVLGAGVGALVGAMLGEHWRGRSLDDSIRIGQAAFWGRVLGTVAKIGVGSAMAVITTVAVLF